MTPDATTTANRRRIIIIGAGFGGLYAARSLNHQPVDVLLIDRHNYHTFTPLLYQVATSGLEPEQIAYPVRGIFHGSPNIRFLLGTVTAIDAATRRVIVEAEDGLREEPYDALIVAGGSVTNTFGNADLDRYAFGLKDLQDAVGLRHHILRLFERAAWEEDAALRQALMTIVVVGGGPTGLETAGAMLELYRWVLRKDYGNMGELHARVILVEASDRLLAPYPAGLQQSAYEQLQSMGVEVMLNSPVDTVAADHITLKDGTHIPTHTLIWAAGVKASPLASLLGVPLARGGRVPVSPTLEALGLEGVYVIGDMAWLEDPTGQPYPMLAPVAQQQGILAARNALNQVQGGAAPKAFQYQDRGTMATIGRNRAVAWVFNRIPVSGFIAWVAWLGLHLMTLVGFRNRLGVLLNWAWNYLTYDRSVRIILNQHERQVELEQPKELGTPTGVNG
ncbi:MAG TPA: NAD(P)/FAD-dependent oxidoreductase [Aggregatilineales bacterium]|nr:NAD(P)/FAD-dependent oxidoreductase [Aggregatilineales bacterium]